ncbi:MAG: restriction endonuclease subunit R [Arcobacter sp.]|nr:restriction endonuclease subunit R [Arcobacter sp.]|tara:strand:- start:7417 stop:10548 length:3132 start_codon:yes stop_codon:yes gene_type:complete
MSIHDKHKENQFETEIVEYLSSTTWIEGTSQSYDKELSLYPEDLLSFIKTTQPKAYEKMAKREGDKVDDVLCKFVARELDKKGSLYYFRHDLKYIGSKFKLCQFKPELENDELEEKYKANILRVVRQVYYSKDNKKSIDIVLFLNGIPLSTIELKTDFTQNIQDAIIQYKKDRLPKGEPLLEFKKRCLVHFAVSADEVYMTTKLAGNKTFFLPFNKGKKDGSAGNPPNIDGYATSYLWEEVLQKDSLLNIISRYIHLEIKDKEDHTGRKYISETLIFPRYHQLDVVKKLLWDTKQKGAGHNYLIQHSAGSGKSNSIAWLAHQLSTLHDNDAHAVFNSTIVITDRTVLDSQLQETISSFEHKDGVVVGISREGSNESKSAQLADALERGAKIIITTIQTFPFILEAIQKRTTLKENKYAIIADEAHSSQTGGTAKKLKEVLSSQQIGEDEEFSVEDIINAQLEAKANSANLSYYAFTATPKPKTLEMFGVLPDPTQPPSIENKPQAFHHYSMKQAIEEGFILDVLKGYTTYKLFYELEHQDKSKDTEVESKKAKRKISKWLTLHPHNIAQKVEVIIEHFISTISHLLDNQAKAMVVTSSRQSAVRYKLAFDDYIRENNLSNMQVMVAFSGKVEDDVEGLEKEYTEANLNPNLKGRDMRKAFDTNEYQVMLVANKFQTGFDQPKLCAMYVDKKLGGVDCVQTLSRLNRTYAGKEQTFILDFVNDIEDIKEAFEPYYTTSEIDDITDPNIVYDIQSSLEGNGIYTDIDVENYAQAFFNPKGTQAQMSSALKPSIDRYKGKYKEALISIQNIKEALGNAKQDNDEKAIHNLEIDLKEANEIKSALEIFKANMVKFVRMYEFLSQIVDYADEDLEKLCAFTKGLIPNLRTVNTSDDVDISLVELTRYQLHKQKEQTITLEGGEELKGITDVGTATPKDPEKVFLTKVVEAMNTLFKGEFTDDDVYNYAKTISDKVKEDTVVIEQISNNTKEQAMLGGFADRLNDAVIDSLDIHQNMATQVLSEDKIRKGLASIVYDVILKGISSRERA